MNTAALSAWWPVGGVALYAAGYLAHAARGSRKWHSTQVHSLEVMSPEIFGKYVVEVFRSGGYEPLHAEDDCIVMRRYGAKLVLRSIHSRVRAGMRAVEALVEGRAVHECDEATLVCSAGFTAQARAVAKTHGVELIDSADLARWAKAHPTNDLPPALILIDNEAPQIRRAA